MSGTFSKNRDAYFVNLDLIAWVEPTKSSEYPDKLLKFFAHFERERVRSSGLPHNGKMFGFYDPTDPALDSHMPPFNKKFLSYITKQRIDTSQGTHRCVQEIPQELRSERPVLHPGSSRLAG